MIETREILPSSPTKTFSKKSILFFKFMSIVIYCKVVDKSARLLLGSVTVAFVL